MSMKRRIAVRVGVIGALIGALSVVFDTYRVEQYSYHVLGYYEWPDASSAVGIAVYAVAASFLGFITFFIVSLVVAALLPRRVGLIQPAP